MTALATCISNLKQDIDSFQYSEANSSHSWTIKHSIYYGSPTFPIVIAKFDFFSGPEKGAIHRESAVHQNVMFSQDNKPLAGK